MAPPGMIIFGLLAVFIDCLNGQITHLDSVMIRPSGKAALIKCKVDSASVIHLYKAPPKGALQRLMYFEAGSTKPQKDTNVPRRFSGSVKGNEVTLTISKTEPADAGFYYCAIWSGDKKVFGSGTRLYVTEPGKDKFINPNLSGYLPSKPDPKNGKQAMLCQASGMFPDLVRFEWKKNGATVPAGEGEVVEQRKEQPKVTVTSMLILDEDKAKSGDYECAVIHEGNTDQTKSVLLKKDKPSGQPKDPNKGNEPCTPSTEKPKNVDSSGDSDQLPSMSLFVYAYSVMLMKNGLFFGVVSVFLLKRRAERKEESS